MAAAKVSPTEISYSSGVTSAIQTQLNAKGVSSVTSASISSDYTVGTSAANVTGLAVTFTTIRSNEVVLLSVMAGAKQTASPGSLKGLYLSYTVDAGSDVILFYENHNGAAGEAHNISFSKAITIAAAGSHTIQLRAFMDTGGNWAIIGSATLAPGTIQVTQIA